ncbi:hypothetical protein BC826DRAFT_588094 [Russula brevipes]|nr:hypothetical protein BC826DRAFT_588094 [Russula brevipes]
MAYRNLSPLGSLVMSCRMCDQPNRRASPPGPPTYIYREDPAMLFALAVAASRYAAPTVHSPRIYGAAPRGHQQVVRARRASRARRWRAWTCAQSKRTPTNIPADEVLYPRRTQRRSRRTPNAIDALPDDVLLDAFDHYRLAVGAHRYHQPWHTLAHVCRRWRELVLASSRRLDLQLRCTFGTPAEDLIAYSPPLPLVLDYHSRHDERWTYADMDGVLAALQHLHRARDVVLSAPAPALATLAMAMVAGPAPMLECLELESQTTELVLPPRLLDGQAPRLRRLVLGGCAPRALRPLLSSATSSLVHLALHRMIPGATDVSPDSLASCMRAMPRLRTLSISFLTPEPPSTLAGQRLHPDDSATHVAQAQAPSRTSERQRTELPALEDITYVGPAPFLDALLAAFSAAPHLRDLHLTLFDQLALSIPHIAEFIHAHAGDCSDGPPNSKPEPTLALAEISEFSASLALIPPAPAPAPASSASAPTPTPKQTSSSVGSASNTNRAISSRIRIAVPCPGAQLASQLAALASLTSALSDTLSLTTTQLMLDFHAHARGYDDDAVLWRSVLAPFCRVRALRVDAPLGAELARALAYGMDTDMDAVDGGELEGAREGGEARRLLLPALCAVGPLYRVVVSDFGESSPSPSMPVPDPLHELMEQRNRYFAAAAGRPAAEIH